MLIISSLMSTKWQTP